MKNPTIARGTAAIVLAAALVLGIVVFVQAVRGQEGGGYTDPDAGLSDEMRDSKYKTASARSASQQEDAIAEFEQSGIPISDLPRVSSTAFFAGSDLDLDGVTSAAPVIVHGVVGKQHLTSIPGYPAARRIVSTIAVSESLKGAVPGGTLDVEQAGAVIIRDDGSFALVINDDDPVLRESDEVVLFLKPSRDGTRYQCFPYKTLTIDGGVVRTLPGDESGRSLNYTNAEDLIAHIRERAGSDSQP
jgi:hypothetical protein